MGNVILGHGPLNSIMVIGEAPGQVENYLGENFVGKAGKELRALLKRNGMSLDDVYRTNLVKEYTDGNPDPTRDQIEAWTEFLINEISQVNPKLIIAVGRFAAKWLLGEDADIYTVHGIPCRAACFDRCNECQGTGMGEYRGDETGECYKCKGIGGINPVRSNAVIVPVYHPAAGFHDGSIRAYIEWDFRQVRKVWNEISTETFEHTTDRYPSCYTDVTGRRLAGLLLPLIWPIGQVSSTVQSNIQPIAIDTEYSHNSPDDPWSIQVCINPGYGYVLRASQPDLNIGIAALQTYINHGALVILHNASTPSGCLVDVTCCLVMGLDLTHTRIFDTMHAAYLLGTEPKALDKLSWRWLGMYNSSYKQIMAGVGPDIELNYLKQVEDLNLDAVQTTVIENNGERKPYKPQSLSRKAKSIRKDFIEGKATKATVIKPGETDMRARWHGSGNSPRQKIQDQIRHNLETEIGPMPEATFDDLDLDVAVQYSGQDADVTLRLFPILYNKLVELGVDHLMEGNIEVLQIAREMQENGMLASRSYFENLSDEMLTTATALQDEISQLYFNGDPFNAKSPSDVVRLLELRGLEGSKRTGSGSMSTSKPSIEHLRYSDPAVKLMFDVREHRDIESKFCQPVLKNMIDGPDIQPVRPALKMTTKARRFACEDPNLLAFPKRQRAGSIKGLSQKVRTGFKCGDGLALYAADLSQIELRFMAYESGDETLCRLFCGGADIHNNTASNLFSLPVDQLDKNLHRVPAKTVMFGILYGQSGSGLLNQLQMLGLEQWYVVSGPNFEQRQKEMVRKCERLIEGILSTYPGMRTYINQVKMDLFNSSDGIVRDHWGMPRHLPGIWSPDNSIRAKSGRQAVSQKIQGGAQGMIQNSMRWLRPRIEQLSQQGLELDVPVLWRLQIHDEVLFTCAPEMVEELDSLVIEALTEHSGLTMDIPILANGGSSDNWGAL